MADHEGETPGDMTLERLREEVWFWRQNEAARLDFRLAELKVAQADWAAKKLPAGAVFEAERRLRDSFQTLKAALEGDFFGHCEACGNHVRPGQVVIAGADGGELHAACMDAPDAKPGDKVYCDPESIEVEEGEPLVDHVVAFSSSPLFDHAGIIETLAEARAALRAADQAGA